MYTRHKTLDSKIHKQGENEKQIFFSWAKQLKEGNSIFDVYRFQTTVCCCPNTYGPKSLNYYKHYFSSVDLQETVNTLLEEKKQLACQLQEQQRQIEELTALVSTDRCYHRRMSFLVRKRAVGGTSRCTTSMTHLNYK